MIKHKTIKQANKAEEVYSIHIINENGHGSYLSVKDKTEWKTKATAIKHAKDIINIKNKSGRFKGMLVVHVENQHGQVIYVWATIPNHDLG